MARSPAILLKEPAAAVSTPPMQEKPRAAFLTPSRYEPYAGDAYAHVDVIGRGAFGLVTKMRCRADGGLVAMKTVDRSRLHTAYLQKTAHREARTLRRLGAHLHIVALREVIECDRSIHIVLELVDGCTVAELCGRAVDGRLGRRTRRRSPRRRSPRSRTATPTASATATSRPTTFVDPRGSTAR